MPTNDLADLERAATDDSTVLDERDARALTEMMTVLADQGPARDADGVYLVITESGHEYVVDQHDGSCTCPDALHRNLQCKHQRRVAFATAARPLPTWVDDDAIDPQLGAQVQGPSRALATDGGTVATGADADEDDEVLCTCDDLDGDLECARCAIATRDDGQFFWEV